MADMEKVIKGLEICTANPPTCRGCPYYDSCKIDAQKLKEDALALLKEQNPITQSNGSCPNCGWDFENGDLEFSSLDSQKFYCPNCGQAVKWE